MWLRRLHDEVHVTTIFVTHDQEEAMEVAQQIVVMNDGAIEQVGEPRDLYENPQSEFVMGFVGPVNRFGEAYVRPHDLDIQLQPNDGAERARIERVTHLGFEVRVELAMPDDGRMWAQVTRAEAGELNLEEGQAVYVRPSRRKTFNGVSRTRRRSGLRERRAGCVHRARAADRVARARARRDLDPAPRRSGGGALAAGPLAVSRLRRGKTHTWPRSSSAPRAGPIPALSSTGTRRTWRLATGFGSMPSASRSLS